MNINTSNNQYIKNELYLDKISSKFVKQGKKYNERPKIVLINIDKDYKFSTNIGTSYSDKYICENYIEMKEDKSKRLKYSDRRIIHVSLKNILAKEIV